MAALACGLRWSTRALVGVAAGTGRLVGDTSRPRSKPVARYAYTSGATALASGGDGRDIAITPDGSRVVYRGNSRTSSSSVRSTSSSPTVLPVLVLVRACSSQPDGQWVGFFDGNHRSRKWRSRVVPPVTLCAVDGVPRGATWGPDGTIVFATAMRRRGCSGSRRRVVSHSADDARPGRGRSRSPLARVPAGRPGGALHHHAASGGLDTAQIAVLDLQTGTQDDPVAGGSHAQYVPTGHLVYGAGGTLRAVAFDLTSTGWMVTRSSLSPAAGDDGRIGAAEFAVTADGCVYVGSSLPRYGGARWCGWTGRAARRHSARPRLVYSNRGSRQMATRMALAQYRSDLGSTGLGSCAQEVEAS